MGLSSFSHDYSFIVSGSEDKYVYIWSTYHDLSKFTSVRRDRNDFWEGIKGSHAVCRMTFWHPNTCLAGSFWLNWQQNFYYLLAHNAVVTSAIFAPHPSLIVPQETGAEKPEAECKSLDSTDSETIPSGMFASTHSWVDFMTSRLSFLCFTMWLSCPLRSPKDRSHRGTTLRWLHWSHQSVHQCKKVLSTWDSAHQCQVCLSDISPKDGWHHHQTT